MRGGTADRLRAVVARLARLGAEQRAISAEVAALTAEQAALRTLLAPALPAAIPPAAWQPAAPATRPAGEWRPSAVRGLLLWLGAGLVAVAAVIFAAVSWTRLSSTGRLGLLAAVTVAAGGFTVLARRRLPATAEAMAALTIALLLVDWGVADLAGLGAGWTGGAWWALGCWLAGAGAVAAGTALRSPRWIGAGLLQCAALLTVFALGLSALASGLLLAAAAGAGTVAAALLGRAPGWRAAAAVTGAGAVLLELLTMGPVLAELFDSRQPAAAIILAAMACAPAAAVALRRPAGAAGHLLAALTAGLLLAAGSALLAAVTSGWALAAAVTILGAAGTGAARLLPRPLAPGATTAAAAALTAGAALPLAAALTALVTPLATVGTPWTGPAPAPWPGADATLPVIVALTAVAAAARFAATAHPVERAERAAAPAGSGAGGEAGAPGRGAGAVLAAPSGAGTAAAYPCGGGQTGAAGAVGARRRRSGGGGGWPWPVPGVAGAGALAGVVLVVAGAAGGLALAVAAECSLVAAVLAALADRGGRVTGGALVAGFAAVVGLAALGWALGTEAGTLTHLATVVVVTGVAAGAARSVWLRGSLAAVAAAGLLGEAAAVTVSLGGGVAEAGIALAVTGGILVAAGTRLPLGQPVRAVAECAGLGGLAAGLAFAADRRPGWPEDGAPLAVALTAAVPLLLLAGDARRAYRWAALVISVLASCAWLAASGVGTPEAYTLPAAVAALVPGLTVLRGRGSWLTFGPGLALALLPSLAVSLGTGGVVRPVTLAAAAFVIVLAGAWTRFQAPLMLGAATLIVLAVDALGPVAVALPRWLTIGTAGLLLLWVGATWERRRDQLRAAHRRYDEALT